MKNGDIRKLLINYYGGKAERIAVLLEETDAEYCFFSIDGVEFNIRKALLLSESSVRNLPAETSIK